MWWGARISRRTFPARPFQDLRHHCHLLHRSVQVRSQDIFLQNMKHGIKEFYYDDVLQKVQLVAGASSSRRRRNWTTWGSRQSSSNSRRISSPTEQSALTTPVLGTTCALGCKTWPNAKSSRLHLSLDRISIWRTPTTQSSSSTGCTRTQSSTRAPSGWSQSPRSPSRLRWGCSWTSCCRACRAWSTCSRTCSKSCSPSCGLIQLLQCPRRWPALFAFSFLSLSCSE